MKEKIIRKVKKKRVEDRIQVSKGGSVTRHEFQKEREGEATPSGDINNLQPVIRTEIRIRIFPFGGEVFWNTEVIVLLKLYSKEETISTI